MEDSATDKKQNRGNSNKDHYKVVALIGDPRATIEFIGQFNFEYAG